MRTRFFLVVLLASLFFLPTMALASMAAKGGPKPDSLGTTEPVNLANGNLFVPATDVRIPGRGPGLELTRTFNSQVITHFPHGWNTGLGSWVVENGEASGEGGQNWHPKTWGDFELTVKMKTIAQDPEGQPPDLEFYTGWIHFRFQDYNNHYQLLMKTTGAVELVKYYVENGQVERQFWRQQTSFSPFNWNTFTLRMAGGQIVILVNGTTVFNILDPDPLPAGRIGLEAHRSHAHWDDFTLTDLSTGMSHTHIFDDIPNQEGIFGYGWTSNLEMQILEDMPEDSMTMVIREDGREDHFMRNADGSYTAPLGIHDQLSKDAGGYTLRRKDGFTWKFDLQGRLTSVADRNDNVTAISQDTAGRPVTVTDPSGRTLTFTYGANGKVSQMTDPAGRQWLYTYDPANHLTRVTDPLGLTEQYAYDPVTHNMVRLTDKSGAAFQYTYTIDDRVKTQTDPEGKVTAFIWQVPYAGLGGTATTLVTNSLGETWSYRFKLEDEVRPEVHDQIHVITDPYGNTEGFAWDVDKNRIGKTDESDRSVFWEYDAGGNPTKIIQFVPPAGSGKSNVSILQYEPAFNQITALYDPNEHETHYEYDPKGNLVKLWRPFNYVDRVENTYTYDSTGQVLNATDPLGRQTSFGYDAHGSVVSVTDAMGNVTAAVYDILGRPTSMTDAKGNTTRYAWDAGNRLVKITDALGGETLYEYDGNGNVTAVTDPEGHTTRFAYDGVGNLTQVTDPLGNVTRYSWDTADFMHFGTSRLTGMTDPKGNTTHYEYDKRGRLVKVADAKGGVTQYGYDKTTHVTSITDANNHTATFEYDDMERLTRAVDPLGNVTLFSYDRLGHLTSKTNAEGQTTTYLYDELDRVKRITYSDGSTVAYTYDKAGNRTQMADNSAVTVYTYDALNRLTSSYPGLSILAVSYAYDAVGNRLRMENPLVGATTTTYDALNRMTRLTDPQGNSYDFAHDRAGQRTSLRFPNGMTTTYGHDAASRIARLETKNSSLQPLLALAYAYDPAGDLLTLTRGPAGTAGAGTAAYAYDPLHQLIQASYPDGAGDSFTYDPVGNRLTANGTPYLYDAANRLTRAGRMTYAYDKTGNRTAQHGSLNQSMAFTYDGANRLAAVDRAQTLNLSLWPGWNLVANPFLAGPSDIGATLSPLQLPADYDQVSRYNGASGTFEHFVGTVPYDQFNTLDPARGYPLYVTNPAGASVALPQAGPSSAQTVSLNTGWNLIGSPRSEPLSAAQALDPLVQGVDYDSVMEMDPSTGGYRSASTLRPGTAYWLHTLRPAVLTIPATASHAVTYAYDGDGNRVSKTVNGVTTRYLYDGLEILAELDGSSDSVLTSYVHGPGLDELLAVRDHAAGQTLYPLTDHLGSVIALTDSAGAVQATFSYAAFGATRSSTGTAGTRFGFTGRENDPESGLLHYRARAYDPAVGRFLQQDPWPRTPADPRMITMNYLARLSATNHPLPGVGFLSLELPSVLVKYQTSLLAFPLSLNSYVYVLNNPTDFVDPLGLSGKLRIHSYEGDGGLLSGHSWIEYQNDNGTTTTYGTYGNTNGAQGVRGLNTNTELNYPSGAVRETHISDTQETSMMDLINSYSAMGKGGWTYLNPCSSFAANVWNTLTGENLNSRNWLGVSNPRTLAESITQKNGEVSCNK